MIHGVEQYPGSGWICCYIEQPVNGVSITLTSVDFQGSTRAGQHNSHSQAVKMLPGTLMVSTNLITRSVPTEVVIYQIRRLPSRYRGLLLRINRYFAT